MSIFLLSSDSGEKPAENSSDAAPRTIDLHGLRVFEQTDRGRKLRVLNCGCQPGQCLRVRDVRRHLKDFTGKVIDPVYQTAAASNENARAGVVNERFFFERALEQLESFTQAQMNNRVQCFALDFLPRKSRIVFEQNRFAGQ